MRYIFLIIMIVFMASMLFADTIIIKDGKKIKGLVVDEYVDRVTLSTADGERDVFRKDIERIEYDTPEQNFMQLGRAYDAKGWYDKAAFYYKKAMEINPDFKEARESYLASHAKMWRQEERRTRKELKHRNMIMDWWENRNKKAAPEAESKASLLKDTLGISLIEKDGIFQIEDVRPYSSADKAGIEEGDLLVGIWGKLIRYNKMDQVMDELLGPKYSEVRVVIEREIQVVTEGNTKNLYKELGIILGFEYEGLTVKDFISEGKGERLGFKKGDYVTAIDKKDTRYLPLDSVIALINSSKNDSNIVFTVQRKLNLRREGQ